MSYINQILTHLKFIFPDPLVLSIVCYSLKIGKDLPLDVNCPTFEEETVFGLYDYGRLSLRDVKYIFSGLLENNLDTCSLIHKRFLDIIFSACLRRPCCNIVRWFVETYGQTYKFFISLPQYQSSVHASIILDNFEWLLDQTNTSLTSVYTNTFFYAVCLEKNEPLACFLYTKKRPTSTWALRIALENNLFQLANKIKHDVHDGYLFTILDKQGDLYLQFDSRSAKRKFFKRLMRNKQSYGSIRSVLCC